MKLPPSARRTEGALWSPAAATFTLTAPTSIPTVMLIRLPLHLSLPPLGTRPEETPPPGSGGICFLLLETQDIVGDQPHLKKRGPLGPTSLLLLFLLLEHDPPDRHGGVPVRPNRGASVDGGHELPDRILPSVALPHARQIARPSPKGFRSRAVPPSPCPVARGTVSVIERPAIDRSLGRLGGDEENDRAEDGEGGDGGDDGGRASNSNHLWILLLVGYYRTCHVGRNRYAPPRLPGNMLSLAPRPPSTHFLSIH